jgi:uncharacterized repeat protein (TIGR01451 family)
MRYDIHGLIASRSFPISLVLAWPLFASVVYAAPPVIYSSPAYQSPVRADPDDLLLLPGYALSSTDRVVYRAISTTTGKMEHPAAAPEQSTESAGIAELVTAVDAPYSLTVRLPEVLRKDQSYAIWAVNSLGEWSNGVRINDARPLWITPNEVYASARLAGPRRVLKVVGRNLQHAPGALTRVRLIGASATYTLPALVNTTGNAAVDRYVAKVELPKRLSTGNYRVELTRDGTSWVPLQHETPGQPQVLSVLQDPESDVEFPVGNYTFGACDPSTGSCSSVKGRCEADRADDDDQTTCIVAAVAAAQAAGGGVVQFRPGTWKMTGPGTWANGNPYSNKGVSHDGVLLPKGVSIRGEAGAASTAIVRGAGWDINVPSFALQGHNRASGLTFRDAQVYHAKDIGTGLLTLGVRLDRTKYYHAADPPDVTHVVIENNVFDRPYYAISNGGMAIDHLLITHNVFGAFKTALVLEGNRSNAHYRYHYRDSAVTFNEFFPGSYLDTAIGQGAMATGLSGGYRTDFSENRADGTSTAYLYDPKSDAKGWRAAHFWAMHDNVEMSLVSENVASCTGDKDGDGEAIAYDNNHNLPGFAEIAVPVVAAASTRTASAVTVDRPLIDTQVTYGASIDVRPVNEYYVGEWLQIVQGPGLGQARKVSEIRAGSNAGDHRVTLVVSPALDVLPQTNSLVTLGRIFWQTYTVGNVIDQRQPLCLKSNRTRKAGGMITLYAATADSVVEGNVQYDTSGISVVHQFELADRGADVVFPGGFVQSFTEIRGNKVIGTYDINDGTPQAEYGIALGYGATPHTAPPPVLSYGLAVSHNTIERAAGPKGAISLNQGWYTGPISQAIRGVTPWKIADSTLLFKNTLTDMAQPHSHGVGIGVSAASPTTPIEWRSVLYGNVCDRDSPPQRRLVDLGTETVRFCPSSQADSCECAGPPTDLGITGTVDLTKAAVSREVTYTLLVENHGPVSATGATLSAELPAGLTILSMNGVHIVCDAADAAVNLCHLGNIEAGASVRVQVVARISAIGASLATFSVAHQEPDTHTQNDSVGVLTVGTAVDSVKGDVDPHVDPAPVSTDPR